MAQFKVPASPKVYTTSIEQFRGVDFSNNATQVTPNRSPDAVNLISNKAGFPIKTQGYELVHDFGVRINGIYRLFDGTEHILIHAGSKLYEGMSEPVLLSEDFADNKSMGFQMNEKFWIMDGKRFKVVGKFDDVFSVKNVSDIGYVPTTSIARSSSGGGTQLEYVNLMQPKRKNTFLSKASETTFQLDASDLDDTALEVKILQKDGTWTTKTETTDFTVDRKLGQIKLTTAPGESPVLGRDNIEVTFSKTVESYAERINLCTTFGIYGIAGSDNRVFVTGNEKMKNYDWFSAVDDPTYIADLNYSRVGQASAIIGYRKIGEYMSIHKEDNQQDPTVYLRSGYLDAKSNPVFSIKQGVVGVGAISKYAFANLRDDSLFLARQGVNAIVTNQITGERFSQDRSYYVNTRLTQEKNLEEATAIEYNGFYYLSVNGNVYVADSRQKVTENDANSESYQYEWYFLNNRDARCWYATDELYFGRTDGKLCKFNDTSMDLNEPTKAYWTTPLFTFNTLTNYKTLKQFVLMLNPYLKSSVDIYYRVKSIQTLAKSQQSDIFDFNDLDFSRFTFNTDDGPRIVVTNKKAKKFMTIQFLIKNENPEQFGFLQMELLHVVLNSKYKGGS